MADAYLVLFVADPATDGHAEALRAAARRVRSAGFFDDPAGGEDRTVGCYLRTDDVAGGGALLAEIAAVSRALGARIEVQHGERILGCIVAGEPDADLRRQLPLGDIPDPL